MSVEKVALINAGGSGMGADAARGLAADGFRVGILSSSGNVEALGKELGGFCVQGSNRSTHDFAALVQGAKDRSGGVDLRVDPAGAAFSKLYADQYAAAYICMNNVPPGFVDSWLASEEDGYMTGQNLRIDGGLTRAV